MGCRSSSNSLQSKHSLFTSSPTVPDSFTALAIPESTSCKECAGQCKSGLKGGHYLEVQSHMNHKVARHKLSSTKDLCTLLLGHAAVASIYTPLQPVPSHLHIIIVMNTLIATMCHKNADQSAHDA